MQAPPILEALEKDTLRARRFRSSRTIFALVLREMATSYGRSPGGYLWAILDPVLALALLSIIFSLAFSAPSIGTSFPLFYATGYLPFMMFNDVANKMATSINFSRPLLAYPAVTFVDALAARFLLNVLTHLMVAYLVFTGIILLMDVPVQIHFGAILVSLYMASILGIGIGTLNCYLMTAFPIWERSWQIATRPLFIISGIFFIYDDIPAMGQDIIWYNPLIHVVGMMRQGIYATYDASYVSVTYVTALSLGCLTMGMLLLWRHHRQLLES
ncbi:ABC transporter permease [Phaeovulum sp. W22_SRMD_FR3]|uniref:ABC transporter permease n=1 Tax=Phaeovulum sp. W22_SRMD_FR3 TaxID=3240274 RepID=UPI003F9AFA1B